MLLHNLVHLFLAEDFENGGIGESQVDRTALLHKECSIVDNTTLEQALNDELFLLKISVDFDHTTLQEVKFVSIGASFLKLGPFNHGFGVERVNNVVQDGIIGGQVLEVGDLLHRFLDEFKHLVVILVDSSFDLVLNLWLHRDDFFVILFGELAEIAIFLGHYCGSSQTIVYNRDFTEEVTWSQ